MKKNDLIELRTEKMVNRGLCIGRIEGKIIFVDGCLPGELVKARIKKIKKDYVETIAEEIIEKSNQRVNPKCKYFGLCGGCKLQNINYKQQLTIKKSFVEEAFERITKLTEIQVNEVIGSEPYYFYRNKMEFSFAKRWLINDLQYTEMEKEFALGLHIPNQFDKVIHLDECFLQSDFSNKIRNFIGDFLYKRNVSIHSLKNKSGLLKALMIRESKNTAEKLVGIVTTSFNENIMSELSRELKDKFPEVSTFVNLISYSEISSTISNEFITLFGKGYIIETLMNYKFEIYPNTFFQTNTNQAERMFGLIKEYIKAEITKDQDNNKLLIDLYSGVGTIGIIFSKFFEKVIGFEDISTSIQAARKNAMINNVNNVHFIQQDLNKGFEVPDELLQDRKLILIVDPPRSGMSQKTISSILRYKPFQIIYISCNPITQARDILSLKDTYRLMCLQPIDMFPQTFHVENIAILRLTSQST